jgi:hypothetical protein
MRAYISCALSERAAIAVRSSSIASRVAGMTTAETVATTEMRNRSSIRV